MTIKGLGMSFLTLEPKPEKILILFLVGLFLPGFVKSETPGQSLPPLYKKCNGTCTAPLECIDYSFISPKVGKLCELLKPDKNEGPCLTKVDGVGFFRWKYQETAKVSKFDNAPAIKWTTKGCYLEKGEICNMDKHKDAKAETWEVCKVDHGCVAIKDKWGFCKYNSSPTFVISSSLLLLVLAIFCSSF